MMGRLGAEHYGAERLETAEAKAERIIAEELKRRKWGEKDLARRAKGDLGKVAIAARVRAETVVTVALQMGATGYVNNRAVSVTHITCMKNFVSHPKHHASRSGVFIFASVHSLLWCATYGFGIHKNERGGK